MSCSTRPDLSKLEVLSLSFSKVWSTTSWYKAVCSAVREQYSSIIIFSGKSDIIDLSVFKRRIIKGAVICLNLNRAFLLCSNSIGLANSLIKLSALPNRPGLQIPLLTNIQVIYFQQ